MNSPDITRLELALEALPDNPRSRSRLFTPEEDALILKYWERKPKRQVAAVLGISENTIRKRWETLTTSRPGSILPNGMENRPVDDEQPQTAPLLS